MKKTIMQTYLLILALGLTLIWSDCNFFDKSLSIGDNSIHRECADILNDSELSHTNGSEDNVLLYDSKTKSNISNFVLDSLATVNVFLTNSFVSGIWQPPKLS